jgi:putative sterol carrier protein
LQFLTDEWAAAVGEALGGSDSFLDSIKGVEMSLQFNVTEGPGGDVPYYVDITGGKAGVVIGTADDPTLTITAAYETMAAISKGELNTQMAFMTGKLKVSGDMGKLMLHQKALNEYTSVVSGLDVTYA